MFFLVWNFPSQWLTVLEIHHSGISYWPRASATCLLKQPKLTARSLSAGPKWFKENCQIPLSEANWCLGSEAGLASSVLASRLVWFLLCWCVLGWFLFHFNHIFSPHFLSGLAYFGSFEGLVFGLLLFCWSSNLSISFLFCKGGSPFVVYPGEFYWGLFGIFWDLHSFCALASEQA